MNPIEVEACLEHLISVPQPTMIWGSPGIGKSDTVRKVAKKTDRKLIDLRLSQIDAPDLRGLGFPNSERRRVQWFTSEFLPDEERDGPSGILFLDEINAAVQSIQAAAYQLVLDRQLGDYRLPDGWAVVAAGNRRQDRAIVNEMSTALRNRFTHLEYEVSNEAWDRWALDARVNDMVRGYIRFRPTQLNEFEARGDSKKEQERIAQLRDAKAFATPRSWHFVSKILDKNPPPAVEMHLISGTVGEGNATDFYTYVKYHRQMPDLDALIKDPSNTKVPKELGVVIAICTGLAVKTTTKTIGNVIKYLDRLENPEYAVLCIKDAAHIDPNLTNTPEFNKWAMKHADVLI